ncbi:MAG: hypothetical protein HQK79_07800 [Desulfobacterales bacterium]|nr:hypothetical protein [Desulfobacterales bacterium]
MHKYLKPLASTDKGDILYYNGVEFYVKKKDAYDVSDSYSENQWTLIDKKGNTFYLILSHEQQGKNWEYSWIFTKEIPLTHVNFKNLKGKWEAFKNSFVPISPPQTIQYKSIEYDLHAQNTGQAKNDLGQMVTKITWDYIDKTQNKNLALEIWKESDKDYIYAYDGEVIEEKKIEILPEAPLRRYISKNNHPVASIIAICFFIDFIVLTGGVAFDYILYISVPIIIFIILMSLYTPFAWLVSIFIGMTSAIIFLFLESPSFLAAYIIFLFSSLLISHFMMMNRRTYRKESLSFVAWASVLPAAWIYSFHIYFKYAPYPHEGYHLLYACFTPMILTIGCYIVIYITEAIWFDKN